MTTEVIHRDWRGVELNVGDRVIADSLEGTVDSFGGGCVGCGPLFVWVQLDCDPPSTHRRYDPGSLTRVS